MKKVLCFCLGLILVFCLFTGCGKKVDTTPSTAAESENNITDKSDVSEGESESSSNDFTTSGTDYSEHPEVYIITSDSDGGQDSISYHLKNCSALSGKEYEKVSWELVEILGFRHCSKCNPPKYTGYIE